MREELDDGDPSDNSSPIYSLSDTCSESEVRDVYSGGGVLSPDHPVLDRLRPLGEALYCLLYWSLGRLDESNLRNLLRTSIGNSV